MRALLGVLLNDRSRMSHEGRHGADKTLLVVMGQETGDRRHLLTVQHPVPGLAICSNKCNIKHFLRTGALRDLARPDRSLLQEIFHHNLLHNISQRLTNLIQQFLSSEM